MTIFFLRAGLGAFLVAALLMAYGLSMDEERLRVRGVKRNRIVA